MFGLFKSSFKITNHNLILATPMIIFMLGIQAYILEAQNALRNNTRITFAFVMLWILIAAFCSGWFYMVKKALSITVDRVFVFDKDRNKALREVFGSFFYGFGMLFLPFLAVSALTLIIWSANYGISYLGADTYNLFNFGLFIAISCVSYWLMLWVPEILYGTKNPIIALVNSTKKAFITFPRTILLYIIMWLLFIGMYILFQVLIFNPILYFFAMLLNYYLIFFTTILVFTYYEQNFIK